MVALRTAHQAHASPAVIAALLRQGGVPSLGGTATVASVTAATKRFVVAGKSLEGKYRNSVDLAHAIAIKTGIHRSAGAAFTSKSVSGLLRAAARAPGSSGGGVNTPAGWANALLKKLHLPPTSSNVQALTSWQRAEGGHWNNSAKFNPLNTTQGASGAASINSVGVKAYGSWGQGLAATVQTLHNGHYGGILSALKSGKNAQAVASAVGSSPWGTAPFSVGGAYNPGPAPSGSTASAAAPTGTAVRASVRAANAKRGSRASRPLSGGTKAPQTAKDASQGTDQILSLLGFGNLSSTQPPPLSSFLGGPAPVRVAVGK